MNKRIPAAAATVLLAAAGTTEVAAQPLRWCFFTKV